VSPMVQRCCTMGVHVQDVCETMGTNPPPVVQSNDTMGILFLGDSRTMGRNA
jgi:hypothetical protein